MASANPPKHQDRTEWDRVWGSRPVRRLPGPVRIAVAQGDSAEVGMPVHVDIAVDPHQFEETVVRQTDVCPVCGESTANGGRIAVSIYPEFENGISYGLGAWAHESCLATCELVPGVKHVPW